MTAVALPPSRRTSAIAGAAAVAAAANAVIAVLGVRGLASVALVAAVAVPFVLAVLERPQRGLLLLAALVPFDGLLLVVPHPGFVEGWKEALVITVVAATWLAPASSRAEPGRPRPVWASAAGALFVVGLASAALVGGDRSVLGLKIGFFYLLVAVAAWRCPLDRRERDRLVTILLVVGVVSAVYGIAQQLLGGEQLVALGYEYNDHVRFAGGYLRSFSTFVQPFPFGFFLMLVALLGTAHALEERGRLRSRLFLASTPVIALGMASSLVRGAWLGTAVGLLYLGVTRYRNLLRLIPIALVGFLLVPADSSSAALSSSSTEQRVDGWAENLSRIVEHPLGEGIGATGAASEAVAVAAGLPPDYYQPDSHFVKTAIELGVVGLWLFVALIIGAFASVRRVAVPGSGADGAFAAGTAAYVLAAAAASTVATFFEIFPMELYFWLLLAVVATMGPGEATTRRGLGS